MHRKKGFVYLVGAGPGNPEYITVKGLDVLRNCDVVIYDRLVSTELLFYTKQDCKKIYVGKKPGAHAMKQEEINCVLVEETLKGQLVVRLKGGDPFVFGRGGEEVEALKKNAIAYEIIPGITSAVAVPMAAGVPVTHRGVSQSFHVITGHTAESFEKGITNYQALAKTNGTLLFLMGLSHLELITRRLLEEGMSQDTPAMVIEQGTTVYQKSIRATLGTICARVRLEEMHSPVVIVIGKVAALEMGYTMPKVGVTGTMHFIETMKADILQDKGEIQKELFYYPYVAIKCCEDIKITLQELQQYQWIVFTSANGVRCFFDLLKKWKIDRRSLQDKLFAVIGKGTASALEAYGYYADFMPTSYYAEKLGEELAQKIAKEHPNAKVLLARAKKGSTKLTEKLEHYHISYKDYGIYETIKRQDMVEQTIDALPYLDMLMFASASGVRFLCEAIPEEKRKLYFARMELLCIGKETGAELERFGITEYKIADCASAKGLLQLLYGKES